MRDVIDTDLCIIGADSGGLGVAAGAAEILRGSGGREERSSGGRRV